MISSSMAVGIVARSSQGYSWGSNSLGDGVVTVIIFGVVIAVSIYRVFALLLSADGERPRSVPVPQATCFVRVIRALRAKVKAS